MGLPERRALKDIMDNHFEKWKSEVVSAAKMNVEIAVDWDSLCEEGRSHLYLECWHKVYFAPLVKALQNITVDSMGTDALKAKLKKVMIQNKANECMANRWANFENGVILLDHQPHTNVDDVNARAESLTALLEAGL